MTIEPPVADRARAMPDAAESGSWQPIRSVETMCSRYSPTDGVLLGVVGYRIQLPPLEGGPAEREVYIGWDARMVTYFAQVFDGVDANGDQIITLDLGNTVCDIIEYGTVVEALRPYAQIPADMRELLLAQRRCSMERNPNLASLLSHPAQRFAAVPLDDAEGTAAQQLRQHVQNLIGTHVSQACDGNAGIQQSRASRSTADMIHAALPTGLEAAAADVESTVTDFAPSPAEGPEAGPDL